ncbi:Gram-negative bacterial tonB protein [compost metagenome]
MKAKIWITLSLLCIALKVSAQNENDLEKAKNGSYSAYNEKKQLVVEGYLKNGLRDSCWIEYSSGKKVLNKGYYENSVKKGVWEYYDLKGKLIHKYDHTLKKFSYPENAVDSSPVISRVVTNSGDENTKVERAATLLGGNELIHQLIQKNLVLDGKGGRSGDRIYVSFIVDEDGNTSDYKIIKGSSYALNEEVIRVVRLVPHQWIPAIKNGYPIKSVVVQPVDI